MNWVEQNLGGQKCVLTWSSDSAILNYEHKPLIFHTIDRQVLTIIRALVERRRSAVMAYPVRQAEVSIPAAIEACYDLMETSCDRRKVLLVSPRLDVRGLFAELRANYMELNDVFPLGVVKTNGTIKPQIKTSHSKVRDTQCMLLHTSNPRILPAAEESAKIGCMIAETAGMDASAVDQLLLWAQEAGIPITVLLETDPYSANFALYQRKKVPIWGWDTQSLEADFSSDLQALESTPEKYDNDLSISVQQIRNWIRGISRELTEIPSIDQEPQLRSLLETYFEIKNADRSSQLYRQAASLVLRTKAAFESMIAPIEETEKHCMITVLARSPSDRIEDMKRFAQAIDRQDSGLASYVRKAVVVAENLRDRFHQHGNPKYVHIKAEVKRAISQKKTLAVVSYNEPYSSALKERLKNDIDGFEAAEESGSISFLTLKDQFAERTYDRCVIFGRMPYSHSWLLRVAWAPELEIMLYSTEKVLLKKQFEKEEQRYTALFGRQQQSVFLKEMLGVDSLSAQPPSAGPESRNRFPLVLSETDAEDEVRVAPLMDDLLFEEGGGETDDYAIDPDEEIVGVSAGGELVVAAARVTFSDGSFLLVNPVMDLPVFRKGRTLEHVLPHKIARGDQVVLVRGSAKESLGAEILRKAERHPKMQHLKFLVNAWTAALRMGMAESGDTPEKFLARLQKAQESEGVKTIKGSLTVKNWVNGYTIGPQKKKNIKLIGQIYGQQFLIDHYGEIADAVSRLRGLHHQILRRLHTMVLQAGVHGLRGADEDELIDKDFDLHVSDFSGVISLHNVESVDVNQTAEKSGMNRVRRGA